MIRTFLSALCAIFIAAPSFADSIEHRAVNEFIVPGYLSFQQSAADQINAMGRLCTNNDQASLDAARKGFEALVEQWSRIEIIRFGPVAEQNRLERILFWPDRKSIGLKQVQRAIAQQDESVTSVKSLQEKSVALQGLGALEFVLYGTGADADLLEQANFRCHFGLTVVSAIHQVAKEIGTAWNKPDGFATVLTNPGQNNETFRDENETMRAILGVVAHGPGIVFDTRLKKYLGAEKERSAPKSALFWRSELSFRSIAWNAEALGDFVTAVDFNNSLDSEKHWIADSYLFEAKNAVRATNLQAAVLDAPYSAERSKLDYLSVVLHSMQDIATEDLAQALGQSTGFSSLDGD